jgi:hypothetical protein
MLFATPSTIGVDEAMGKRESILRASASACLGRCGFHPGGAAFAFDQFQSF